MSDNEEKRRPNANYKLSKENASPEDIVYHYNRERRLAKAPQSVRDSYKEKPRRRRLGILGPLVSTMPLRMMFFTILLSFAVIMIVSMLGLASDNYELDGNHLSVQAVKYEGATIVVLKKMPQKGMRLWFSSIVSPYTGAVDIAIQPSLKIAAARNLPPEEIFYHKVFFTLEPAEYYRFSVPFDAEELAFVFKTEKKTLSVMIKPE